MFSNRNHANKAYVSLGSNLGDRAGNLLLGVRGMMEAALVVTRLSSIYETQPVSEIEQPAFLNMVAEIGNPLPAPEQVMARLLRVEYALGRTREIKDGPRTIDLDLLLYGNVESNTEFLRLPHPCLQDRRFVLEPLAEMAPRVMHPGLKRTVAELLENSPDKSAVKRWVPKYIADGGRM
jgi:2-amino-4-hydroxy-6-hydroxymethyldihydropteridine diphosphokinase